MVSKFSLLVHVLIPSCHHADMSRIVVTKCVDPGKIHSQKLFNVNFSHFSPFVFTKTLIPLMIETARQPGADVRIVNVCQEDYH
jgi:hypothetical protein